MRQYDPAHHVSELQAPRQKEGDEKRRVDDSGVRPLGVGEPEDLDRCAEYEGDKEEDGAEGGFVLGVRGDAEVAPARRRISWVYACGFREKDIVPGCAVENHAGSAECHEGFVGAESLQVCGELSHQARY